MDQPSSPTPPATTSGQPTWNDSFNQVDSFLERIRVQLPAAPPGLLDGYMKFAPWIAIIFGVLGFLGLLALSGIAAVFSPFLLMAGSSGVSSGASLFLSLAFGLVVAALEVVGGYLMLQRRLNGWWILAAGLVVSALNSLFHAGILSLIILVLIAYIHLQVKPNYR